MAKSLLSDKKSDKAERRVEVLAHEFTKRLEIQPPEFRRFTGMHYGDNEKYVQVRFSESQVKKWGFLEVIHITDVQSGHVCSKVHRLREYGDWVLAEPNRYVVFGGDMIDAANIFSPGQPWENLFDAQSQTYRFCEAVAPFAHRVLGYVGGNHERRGFKGFGDIGILLGKLLQIPYSGGQQIVDIHFGKWSPFSIDLWHGKGAASTPGARMNMLYNYMLQSQANLVLVGHLHDSFSKFRWIKQTDPANMKITFKKQGGAMSSSFLEWMASYAEIMGLPMTDCMMTCAKIEPDGHWQMNQR